MVDSRRKGYRVESKIRKLFVDRGWIVIRSGASLGESDLTCLKDGVCVFLQIKSTSKKAYYYYGYSKDTLSGFPFYLIVDFGYGKIRALSPKKAVRPEDGVGVEDFIISLEKS